MTAPRRTLAAIAASAALAAAAGVAAGADKAPAPMPAERLAHSAHAVRPAVASALLEVRGSGNIVVQGRVAVSAHLPARGVLRVVDRGGDAAVYVSGSEVPLRAGRGLVRRANGIVFASGSNVTLQFTGVRVAVSAAGVGRANLRGAGRYRLNLGPSLQWPRAALRLAPATRGADRARAGAAALSRGAAIARRG